LLKRNNQREDTILKSVNFPPLSTSKINKTPYSSKNNFIEQKPTYQKILNSGDKGGKLTLFKIVSSL
jgi:hypothetical protein